MKTENLGKIKSGNEYFNMITDDLHPDTFPRGFSSGDIIDAFNAGQSNPIVKKLRWTEFHDKRYKNDKEIDIEGEDSQTDIGSYELFEQDGKFLLYTIVGCLFEFETKEEAKEFAQEDFEQMVMGCIETNDNSKNH